VDIGNYLTPSDTNGIVVVTQVDPIDVSFALPQVQLSQIGQASGSGAGLPVEARDQNSNGKIASGRFLTFDNQVDSSTGTVKAKARFDNPGSALFPGGFVNIAMLVQTLHDAVTVPVSAVRHGTQGDFVFTLQHDSKVKLTPVKIGRAPTTASPSCRGLRPAPPSSPKARTGWRMAPPCACREPARAAAGDRQQQARRFRQSGGN
jgi:multidrug efflux system membrane fusion protein